MQEEAKETEITMPLPFVDQDTVNTMYDLLGKVLANRANYAEALYLQTLLEPFVQRLAYLVRPIADEKGYVSVACQRDGKLLAASLLYTLPRGTLNVLLDEIERALSRIKVESTDSATMSGGGTIDVFPSLKIRAVDDDPPTADQTKAYVHKTLGCE